ncbi:MAG: Fic family protein [Magnetococcales bacterium]|nr:Fic family protein [Magnetococcales bacterium]NGZ27769.1 Fic family protein [Magnetococcales bacterium]
MEPMRIPEDDPRLGTLNDLAMDLVGEARALTASLPPMVVERIADLVRSMNCYYSNLIEGHHTHPVDIDRAMSNDYSLEPEKRNLQLEARAHIEVQQWLDTADDLPMVTSSDFIGELHRRFCQHLPEDLLTVVHPTSGAILQVEPGQWRSQEVQVGNHLAPAPTDIPQLFSRFQEAYGQPGSRLERMILIPAVHHRLLWIHPFLDGNGRVARLLSHAMFRQLGLGSSGLWAISRGLARENKRYKTLLMQADGPRQGDLDGRGNLSLKALVEFSEFFLKTALDQMQFMAKLLSPATLSDRILATERLPAGWRPVLWHALMEGEITRGRVAELAGCQERQARNIIKTLLDRGLLESPSSRAPLRLGFPLEILPQWFPGLYPDSLFSPEVMKDHERGRA